MSAKRHTELQRSIWKIARFTLHIIIEKILHFVQNDNEVCKSSLRSRRMTRQKGRNRPDLNATARSNAHSGYKLFRKAVGLNKEKAATLKSVAAYKLITLFGIRKYAVNVFKLFTGVKPVFFARAFEKHVNPVVQGAHTFGHGGYVVNIRQRFFVVHIDKEYL